MVFEDLMSKISEICNKDEDCVFIMLVLFGFLLCMFLNRNEGFHDYAELAELDKNEKEPHDYNVPNPKDLSNQGSNVGKPPENLGLHPEPNKPSNGPGPLSKSIEMARSGPQYKPRNLNNDGKLLVSSGSLPVGFELEHRSDYYFLGNKPSFFGPDRPLDGSNQGKPSKPVPVNRPTVQQDVVQATGDKTLELVLFYAPWCGHSKRMIGDFDAVISSHHGKTVNGVTLAVKKVDMEANKQGAVEYDVQIRGFPTLYTFVVVNGKKIGQLFNFRKQDEIVVELERRANSM